jgi:tetratricopeptide (TPR) repeat protein
MFESVPGPWAIDPETLVEMRVKKAQKAYHAYDFDTAMVEAEELLDDYPHHPDGLRITGQSALAMGDPTTAVAALTQFTDHHEPTPEVLMTLTAAYFEAVNFPKSIESAIEATRLAPDMAEAWFYLGLGMERVGQTEAANQRFERAAALAPEQLPVPKPFTDHNWDGILSLALAALPEKIGRFYERVTFRWDDFPAVEDLLEHYPPLSPFTEALYRGERNPDANPWENGPKTVHLYMANLARTVPREEDISTHLARALVHEALHWVGDEAL